MSGVPNEPFLFGIGRYLLLALLALHVLHALAVNRREKDHGHPIRWLTIVAQSPLFVVAFLYALSIHAFSRQLVSPVYIALGLLAGHVIFGLSVLATHHSLRDVWSLLLDVPSIVRYVVDSPIVLSRYISVAVGEEVIWRVAAQTEFLRLIGRPYIAIAVVAVFFSIVHRHFFRNSLGVSAEFVTFALVLGVLYYWTHSLILVIVIHAVRDIEIAYLEYLVKVDEIGSSDLAAREVEKGFFRRHPEQA